MYAPISSLNDTLLPAGMLPGGGLEVRLMNYLGRAASVMGR